MRTETVETMEQLMPLIRECLAAGKAVDIFPKGTSMLPMLRQGIDSVELLAATEPLRKYDLPLYRYPNGKYVLHRIVGLREDGYICRGDNTYQNEHIPCDSIIAVVTAFYRKGKRIPCDAWGYRLYCRMWCAVYPLRRFFVRCKNWLRRHLR